MVSFFSPFTTVQRRRPRVMNVAAAAGPDFNSDSSTVAMELQLRGGGGGA